MNPTEKIRKFNIKKDRKEIARIIEINLPLMNKNKKMCQEVADAIFLYLIEGEGKWKIKKK